MDRLKRRIAEAERNAGTLIARRNAARARKKIAQTLSGVGETNAFAALESLEARVAHEEATSRAYDSLSDLSDDPTTRRAREFETDLKPGLDEELEKLRRQMSGENSGE